MDKCARPRCRNRAFAVYLDKKICISCWTIAANKKEKGAEPLPRMSAGAKWWLSQFEKKARQK